LKVSEISYDDLSNDIIDKMLFEGILDDGLNGDCILVFGSKKALQYRVPKAVELYKSGRSSKLLFSGGKQIEIDGRYKPEALLMQEKALELGVLREDILVDTISQAGTKENVLGSLMQLDRCLKLSKIKRILLVTTFII